MIKKLRFVCFGCGKDRPCFVESNQEPSSVVEPLEDLRCVLDETNKTGYNWEYAPNGTDTQQTHTKIANDIERAMDMLQPGHPPSGVDIDNCRVALHGIIAQLR